MIEPYSLLKQIFLLGLKILALVAVAYMALIQLPELRYDFGPNTPLVIESPEQLAAGKFGQSTFVSIAGEPDFENAFQYRRYGLAYTYFNVRPYGITLIVRTYDKVDDDWSQINRFIGKLRPFEDQPFSYRIRSIYKEKFDIDVPAGAYFLSLLAVPEPDGWQVGALIFAGVMWIVMFYLFFIRPRRRSKQVPESSNPA